MSGDMATIGVLGGMGPEATILFMKRIVDAVEAGDDADHVPLIVDNNTQVPSRIKALIEGTGEDPGPVLAMMAKRLEKAGAKALVMPCNTAHNYASSIRRAAEIPFLSMVDLTAREIARVSPGARVGLLASPALRITGLYGEPLRQAGLTLTYPAEEAPLLSAIRALKRNGEDAGARDAVRQAAAGLMSAGCDIILIGCSEFSLLAGDLKSRFPAIDSVDVLVEAAVSFSRQEAPGGTRQLSTPLQA